MCSQELIGLGGGFEAPLPGKGFSHCSASNQQFYLVLGTSVSAQSVAHGMLRYQFCKQWLKCWFVCHCSSWPAININLLRTSVLSNIIGHKRKYSFCPCCQEELSVLKSLMTAGRNGKRNCRIDLMVNEQYSLHVKHRWPENRLNYADISFLLLTSADCDGRCTNLDLSVVPLIPFIERFLHVNCGWLVVGLSGFWNTIDTPLETEREIVSFAVQPDLFSLIGSFLEGTYLEKSWRIIGQIISVNSEVLLLIFCQQFHVYF